MARNKYPEETVKKIVDVSYNLFKKKGYDHTTIQDIVDELGLSKGAVYHHFRSKEDILDKINDYYYDSIGWFKDIREDKKISGIEKLREILILQLSDKDKLELDNITMSLTRNPQLLMLTLNATINDAAPFFTDIVRQGVEDGSIQTEYPKELSEVFILLLNVWIGIYTETKEDFLKKVLFLKELTDKMGLPLINDEMMQVANNYFEVIFVNNN